MKIPWFNSKNTPTQGKYCIYIKHYVYPDKLKLVGYCPSLTLNLNYKVWYLYIDNMLTLTDYTEVLPEEVKFETIKTNPALLKVPKYDVVVKDPQGNELYTLNSAWFFAHPEGAKCIFSESISYPSQATKLQKLKKTLAIVKDVMLN